jgi:hypothetical protein
MSTERKRKTTASSATDESPSVKRVRRELERDVDKANRRTRNAEDEVVALRAQLQLNEKHMALLVDRFGGKGSNITDDGDVKMLELPEGGDQNNSAMVKLEAPAPEQENEQEVQQHPENGGDDMGMMDDGASEPMVAPVKKPKVKKATAPLLQLKLDRVLQHEVKARNVVTTSEADTKITVSVTVLAPAAAPPVLDGKDAKADEVAPQEQKQWFVAKDVGVWLNLSMDKLKRRTMERALQQARIVDGASKRAVTVLSRPQLDRILRVMKTEHATSIQAFLNSTLPTAPVAAEAAAQDAPALEADAAIVQAEAAHAGAAVAAIVQAEPSVAMSDVDNDF